jgi:hypothetical protein
LNQKNSTELIVYGLDQARLGLVGALAKARGLSATQRMSDYGIFSWVAEVSLEDTNELVNSIIKLKNVCFEVISTDGLESVRQVYSPSLGLGSTTIDALGNAYIQEHRLRELVRDSNMNMLKLQRQIARELLEPWNAEIENLLESSLSEARASA